MTIEYLQDQLELTDDTAALARYRKPAADAFRRLGIPTVRHEEWKYTRISSVFNKDFTLARQQQPIAADDLAALRLPGSEAANELVFVNGVYSEALSIVRSKGLTVQSLETAAGNEYSKIVAAHFDHSGQYLNDGIHALNTAWVQGGIFVHIDKKQVIDAPVFIYNICDARNQPVLAQPRSLFYISARAEVTIAETYHTLGAGDSMTNQVMEMVVEEDAFVEYYKLQHDTAQASQVSTTHIQQVGRSVVNAVTISLDGNVVRNNLHAVMQAPHAEAHLYGLYFQRGNSHIDNHTIVDNAVPDCQSNELYKGILDGNATGVFNGKIFVRKDAQKTNAFQSNKNVLLSETAGMNTKPQLEIFADDVKCSHGCTIGSLDEEGLFYLQSRGIPKKAAMALLLQGFAMDVLEKIKHEGIREYIGNLISERLMQEA